MNTKDLKAPAGADRRTRKRLMRERKLLRRDMRRFVRESHGATFNDVANDAERWLYGLVRRGRLPPRS